MGAANWRNTRPRIGLTTVGGAPGLAAVWDSSDTSSVIVGVLGDGTAAGAGLWGLYKINQSTTGANTTYNTATISGGTGNSISMKGKRQ